MNFSTQAVTEAIWPEATGIIAYGVGELGAAWVDTYMAEDGGAVGMMTQNVFTGVCFLGGAYLIGARKNVDFGKGLMFGSGVGVLLNTMRLIYDKANSTLSTGVSPKSLGALVPRSFGRVSKPAALIGPGTRQTPVGSGRGAMLRGTLP